jgi:L-ascorbate metabolism protein UlaG (beta-lactamase superfamily)
MPFFSSRYYKGPKSDHFDGRHFFNPWNRHRHSFLDVLRWKLTAKPELWPKKIEHPFDRPPARVEGSHIRLSFVGQATTLIQTCSLNILTDPIWGEWASPVHMSRTRRVSKPGIRFEELPKIDCVLVSHNHYDHMCLETLHKLWERDRPRIITPLGNDTIIHGASPAITVDAIDWYQSVRVDSISIKLLPSQHWSARGLFDRDEALWGAFAIETEHGAIYFAGDTGYGNGEVFEKAVAECGPFRVALLPIGSYEPRWFMRYAHMNPEDALHAWHALGEPDTMALHYETFPLTDEGLKEPACDLEEAKKRMQVPREKFRALGVGESLEL